MRSRHALALAAALCLTAPVVAADEPAEPATDTATLVTELKAKETHRRLAAAEAAKDDADDTLITPLAKLLTDDLYAIRKAAVLALAARTSESGRKKASQVLVRRIRPLGKSAYEQGELIRVLEALHDLAHTVAIEPLLDDIGVDTPEDVVRARLTAVANIPHADAIEGLIGLAARGGRKSMGRQRRLATQALAYATGERLGNDPDTWRAWWKENRRTFDFEAAAAAREESREKSRQKEEKREKKKRRKKE